MRENRKKASEAVKKVEVLYETLEELNDAILEKRLDLSWEKVLMA